jgi:hypothetical protein
MIEFGEMFNFSQEALDILLGIASQKDVIVVSSLGVIGIVCVES